MTDTEELTARLWTYKHRYLRRDGGIGHAWIAHNDEEVSYDAAPSGAVIGGLYKVECTLSGDRARPKSAEFTGDRADVDEGVLVEWRTEDRAAAVAAEIEKARKRLAKEDADIGDLTLHQARRLLAKGLPHQKAATAAVILRYLYLA